MLIKNDVLVRLPTVPTGTWLGWKLYFSEFQVVWPHRVATRHGLLISTPLQSSLFPIVITQREKCLPAPAKGVGSALTSLPRLASRTHLCAWFKWVFISAPHVRNQSPFRQVLLLDSYLGNAPWQLFRANRNRPLSEWMGRETDFSFQRAPGHKKLNVWLNHQSNLKETAEKVWQLCTKLRFNMPFSNRLHWHLHAHSFSQQPFPRLNTECSSQKST